MKKEIEPKSAGRSMISVRKNVVFLVNALMISYCHVNTIPFFPFMSEVMGSLCFIGFNYKIFIAGTLLLVGVPNESV